MRAYFVMPFGLSIALLSSSCTLLAHEVPVNCTEGTPCVGLNTRFGIEDACEMWFCQFTPGQQGTCAFGAIDRDGDGVAGCLPTGGDCQDVAPMDDDLLMSSNTVLPGADEVPCNDVDDDCDGLIDEALFVPATPASVADVDPIDRASLTVLDDGFAWANTTRTRDGEGNDIELGALHRFTEDGPLARRADLAWYFADPAHNAVATFVPGTPEPAPGSLPPWGMLAGVGGFADLSLARSLGNRIVLAGISADSLLCEEGRLRIGVIPDDVSTGSTARTEVLGGPRRNRPEDRDFPRSAISLMVDMAERTLDGETHFCTGPGGASRVALAMAPELVPPVGMVLYAEETASVRRSCGGAPVPLHALGIVEERGGSSEVHVWISGLQAPDGMEGAVSHIESIVIGEITGAGPPAVVAAESGDVFVAFPEGDEVVLLSFSRPASTFAYLPSRDLDAPYDLMGMPVFSEPVELHRYAAPNADHVALAQYTATSGETILGLAWQEGCGAGDEAHQGSIRAATYGVSRGVASDAELIAAVGRTPTLSAARDLVRTNWPITTLGGASVAVADGFVLAYVDGADTLGIDVAWLLEGGQVPSSRLPIATDAAGTLADRVQNVSSATPELGDPSVVFATGASGGSLTLHRAALRCPPP